MTKPMNTWEERFDEIMKSPSYKSVHNFVSSELQRQRSEIVKMIRGMKIEVDEQYNGDKNNQGIYDSAEIWNQALDDIIKKVENDKTH